MRKVVLALLICALAGPAAAKGKDETELKDMVGKVDAAWSTLNPDNVAVYYAKDANLAFFDMAPLKYSGWTAYDQGVRGMFSAFESLKLTVGDDLQATRRGDVAWTTGTVHASVVHKGGSPMEMDARQTLIWEKKGGKWLIVHEHMSAPLPDDAMKANKVDK